MSRDPGPDQDGAALAAVKDVVRRLRRWPAAILDRAHAHALPDRAK
jgi:hypothetical protein